MEDWMKILIGGVVAIILAALGGGAIGKGMLSIAKTLVSAIIEQNQKLTDAIEKNTKETSDLAAAIQYDTEMQRQYNREREKQLDRLEELTQAATKTSELAATNSMILVDKLRGRI